MPDEKPGAEDDRETKRDAGQTQPRSDDRLVDGRLDPDAQSPDDERAKPFDPKENDPA
ncbi:hypothetical protein [Methylobacterium sp. SyP6R]|uniref:hypothetical protein n=1 Tax=Methylobacterium sp. SyP6R TaxID=2718876 RepID=UPI001F2F3BC2|nr:hypothetical protein [Methylobacterium sp. SyP6R]MCF4129478.1 hypothetical protein [Methylobacterium sp. SyP6R]